MIMRNIYVFTDADLDGAGSMLITKLAYKDCNVAYKVTTEKKFKEDVLSWNLKHNFSDYDEVLFLDLNLNEDLIDLIDRDNVKVFDHHEDHVNLKTRYNKAQAILENTSSCTLLLYKNLNPELSDYQKLLVKIIDDYDSYTLNISYSVPLNQIFWNYTGNRVEKFINDFSQGFKGFNPNHKAVLRIVENRIKKYFNEEPLYKGDIKIGGKNYSAIGGFFKFSPNEISEIALKKYNGDFILLINTQTKTVCYRKSKDCDLNMAKLASKLADGGGHEDAAGSLLNDNIINITKLLGPVNE